MLEYISAYYFFITVFISSFVLGNLGYFHHQTKIVTISPNTATTTSEQISAVVPTLSSPTTTARANTPEGTSSPLVALFRTYRITFSYPKRPGAIWLNHQSSGEYLYGFPAKNDEYYAIEEMGKLVSVTRFSLKALNMGAIDENIKRGTIDGRYGLQYAKPFRSPYFSGYILISDGNYGPGYPEDVAVLYNEADPDQIGFVMTNSNWMFNEEEFIAIVKSARPTSAGPQ